MSEFNVKDFETGDEVVVKGKVLVWNSRRLISLDSDILFHDGKQSDSLEIISHTPTSAEPTRLGAVVEADGHIFVKADGSGLSWYGCDEWFTWEGIRKYYGRVTVKFEGPEIAL